MAKVALFVVRPLVLAVALGPMLGAGWALSGLALGLATAAIELPARGRARSWRTAAWAALWTSAAGSLAVAWGWLEWLHLRELARSGSVRAGWSRVELAISALGDPRAWKKAGWEDLLAWDRAWGLHSPTGVAAWVGSMAAVAVLARLAPVERALANVTAASLCLWSPVYVGLLAALACGCPLGIEGRCLERSLLPLGLRLALGLALARAIGDLLAERRSGPRPEARPAPGPLALVLAGAAAIVVPAVAAWLPARARAVLVTEACEQLASTDPGTQSLGLEALAQVWRPAEDARPVASLRRVAVASTDFTVRWEALATLAGLPPDRGVACALGTAAQNAVHLPLLAAWAGQPGADRALAEAGLDVAALVRAHLGGEPGARRCALHAVALLPSGAFPEAVELLHDEDDEVATVATDVLRFRPHPALVPALAGLMTARDGSPNGARITSWIVLAAWHGPAHPEMYRALDEALPLQVRALPHLRESLPAPSGCCLAREATLRPARTWFPAGPEHESRSLQQ